MFIHPNTKANHMDIDSKLPEQVPMRILFREYMMPWRELASCLHLRLLSFMFLFNQVRPWNTSDFIDIPIRNWCFLWTFVYYRMIVGQLVWFSSLSFACRSRCNRF